MADLLIASGAPVLSLRAARRVRRGRPVEFEFSVPEVGAGVEEVLSSGSRRFIGIALDDADPGAPVRVATGTGTVVSALVIGPIGESDLLRTAPAQTPGFEPSLVWTTPGEAPAAEFLGTRRLARGERSMEPVMLMGHGSYIRPPVTGRVWQDTDVAWRDEHEAWIHA